MASAPTSTTAPATPRHAALGRITAIALPPLLGILAAAGLAAPSAASQEPSAAGRWRSDRPAMLLDIGRCREGWCGVQVAEDGRCGAQVLAVPRIAPMTGLGMDDPTGRLALPGQPVWAVRMSLSQTAPQAPPSLVLLGVEPSLPHAFMRRIFPFNAVLARQGEASCVPPLS